MIGSEIIKGTLLLFFLSLSAPAPAGNAIAQNPLQGDGGVSPGFASIS